MELTQKVVHEAQRLIDEERPVEAAFLLQKIAAEATNMLAMIYANQWDEHSAIDFAKLSTEVDYDNWATFSNACHTYSLFLRHAEAAELAVKAIKLSDSSQYAPVFNYAVALANLMRIEEATKMYKLALSMKPDNHITHYNLSYTLLIEGKLGEAWPHYEHRSKAFNHVGSFVARYDNHKKWEGEDLTGKSIVVYNEQGIGDLIFFGRFLPWLKEKKNAAKVIVESQAVLVDLMKSSFPNVEVIARGNGPEYEPAPLGDVAISICSLPCRFEINTVEDIPAPVCYIQNSDRKAPHFLSKPTSKKKIGFSWAGNPAHSLDALRSVHMRWFKKLSDLPDVQLYSLQKEANPIRQWYGRNVDLREGAAGINFVEVAPYLKDFADTIAVVKELDLVITIDSALAHLAAAMGKQVWVLMQFNNDWRWLKNISHSPWYPTMRIFRQPRLGDWKSVFEEVVNALTEVQDHQDSDKALTHDDKTD